MRVPFPTTLGLAPELQKYLLVPFEPVVGGHDCSTGWNAATLKRERQTLVYPRAKAVMAVIAKPAKERTNQLKPVVLFDQEGSDRILSSFWLTFWPFVRIDL